MAAQHAEPLGDRIASRLLRDAGVDCTSSFRPAHTLSTIAGFLEIKPKLSGGFLGDGHSCIGPVGNMVTLNTHGPGTRTVFTFAHELAHLAIWRYRDDMHGLANIEGAQLERLCDAVGAALVLPKEWIARAVDGEPSLAEICSIAGKAHVSPSAVAIRLRDVGYPVCLLRLRRLRGGTWIIAAAVGISNDGRRHLAMARSSALHLDAMANHCHEDLPTRLQFGDDELVVLTTLYRYTSVAYLQLDSGFWLKADGGVRPGQGICRRDLSRLLRRSLEARGGRVTIHIDARRAS